MWTLGSALRIRSMMRFIAASIAARDSFREETGRYVRSISADNRGKIVDEQIDGGSAFQCEATLLCNERQDSKQEESLAPIRFSERHRGSLER